MGKLYGTGKLCAAPHIEAFGENFETINFEYIEGENGLDLFTKASVRYETGMAAATCGLGVKSEGRLLITGTKGYIVVEAPWWKTRYFEVHYENPEEVEKYSERF